MAHVLGAKYKIGDNEGQLHLDVHSLSALGIKLVHLVSKYWATAKKVMQNYFLCIYGLLGYYFTFVFILMNSIS